MAPRIGDHLITTLLNVFKGLTSGHVNSGDRPRCCRAWIFLSYLPGGAIVHSNYYMVPWPKRVYLPNDISTNPDVFAGLTRVIYM